MGEREGVTVRVCVLRDRERRGKEEVEEEEEGEEGEEEEKGKRGGGEGCLKGERC